MITGDLDDSKILRGPPCRHPYLMKTIGELFFDKCQQHPHKYFQIDADTGRSETYRAVQQKSIRLAIHMKNNANISHGDAVLICSENTLYNIIPLLSTLFLGGVVASIDPNDTIDKVEHALQCIRPKLIFTEPKYSSLIKTAYKHVHIEDKTFNVKFITINGSLENNGGNPLMDNVAMETEKEETFQVFLQNPHDTAVYVFTSGTTSTPKPVEISHFGFLHGFKSLANEIDNCKAEVVVHFASLYWISALLLTGLTIINGGTKVIAPRISAVNLLHIIERFKVTMIFMSNTYSYKLTDLPLKIIARYNTSSLYSILIGGSSVNPAQLLKLRAILPKTKVTIGYGSSECGGVSAFDFRNDMKGYEKKLLSSGRILPDVRVKIIDVITEKLLGANQIGEICVKSPFMMKGYHPGIHLTHSAFDSSHFIRTGDLGYYDEDKYLFVTGRLADTFKYQTYQICPSDIENVINQHPHVEECAVFPIPHETDRNHPAAAVVLKHNNSKTSKESLLRFVNDNVSDKNRLRAGLEIVNYLPKSSTGKILRKKLTEFYIKKNNLQFYGMKNDENNGTWKRSKL